MQELQILKQKETVLLKKCDSEFVKNTDIATTLLARDYKGFANRQAGNGVIEWK